MSVENCIATFDRGMLQRWLEQRISSWTLTGLSFVPSFMSCDPLLPQAFPASLTLPSPSLRNIEPYVSRRLHFCAAAARATYR
jgi:hypothetical protein